MFGDMLLPEKLQQECTPENLAEAALNWHNNAHIWTYIKYHLARIREQLGPNKPTATECLHQHLQALNPTQ